MISPEQIAKIRRLVEEDLLSYRKIAELVGVSRGTVARIAAPSDPTSPRQGRPAYDAEPDAPLERCPKCGAWVRPPCLRCWVTHLREEGKLPAPAPQPEEPLALSLRRRDRKRYRQVRADRRNEMLHHPEPEETS